MEIRKLGRLKAQDSRDRLFTLKKKETPKHTKMFWYTSPAYDQGETSECVAYSGVKFLDSAPIRNREFSLKFSFHELYKECQRNDEWFGEDYDGTSVRALFKVLKNKGFIERYEWAFDLETVVNYILTTGPMVVGTWWFDDMFYPNPRNQFISASGRMSGGHAYVIKGCNTKTICPDGSQGAFRIINSWGPNWGLRGCASISFKDFEKLILADGEACTAIEKLNA